MLQQGSGFMDTSDFNSINMMYQRFRTYRIMGYTQRQAWKAINDNYIGGGDDSLTSLQRDPDRFLDAAVKAAAELGQKMTTFTFKKGQPFDFFARWYGPATWFGNPNSCADPARCLSKLASAPMTDTPLIKLEEKFTSLAMTDRQSPGIKELIDKWIEIGGTLKMKDPASWWAQYDSEVQFTNVREDWMDLIANTQGLNMHSLKMQLEVAAIPQDLLELDPVFEEEPQKGLAYRVLVVDEEDSLLIKPEKEFKPKPEVFSKALAKTTGKKLKKEIIEFSEREPKGKEKEEETDGQQQKSNQRATGAKPRGFDRKLKTTVNKRKPNGKSSSNTDTHSAGGTQPSATTD
jgi:hypothetical protein